eukprot:c30577_g1_i1 orf=1-264(-)
MGNVMLDVQSSQFPGENVDYVSQKERNLADADPWSLEERQSIAPVQMLEGITMIEEGMQSTYYYCGKLPSLHEHIDQEKILNMPVIQT